MMIYTPTVSINNFEGPLDLLLHLIQKEEIDVYDIPLQEITHNFLSSIINQMQLELNEGAEFLGGTSLLLLIKSKKLLPVNKSDDSLEEEATLNLLKDLIEYCSFKEMAKKLAHIEEQNNDYYERGIEKTLDSPPKWQLPDLTLEDLSLIFNQLLSKKLTPTKSKILKKEIFVIEERASFLRQLCQSCSQLEFKEIFSFEKSKEELIATFLALLQLIKAHEMRVTKNDNHIYISYVHPSNC